MTSRRILVVEDEPSILETVEYALEAEGFEVVTAGTGEGGLRRFREMSPSFLILDVGLPDRSGFDLCREIRRESNIPILFLTARESEVDRVVGLEIGGDDYVVKPFSPRELTARVQAILRRTAGGGNGSGTDSPPDEWLERGRLRLSRDRREAQLDGGSLELARYEFGMLEMFLRSPERVYTRQQLMERVWDEPEAATDRTVDAHIKTLRRKLHEIDPAFDPIRTHRGIGYSFRLPAGAVSGGVSGGEGP